jgi:hypothetical protein
VVGLGIAAGFHRRDFRLAIRTDDMAKAEAWKARAMGEADIRIVQPQARPPVFAQAANRLQEIVRPVEPGAQVNVVGKNFVGTHGAVVKDRGAASAVRYSMSNTHVYDGVGGTPDGTPIAQPFGSGNIIGVTARHIPLVATARNLVDARLARLSNVETLTRFNAAVGMDLAGARALNTDDLGREFFKIGRTTQVRAGRLTAFEIDGLAVAYDRGVFRFDDQHEWSGGSGADFSAGGDSGSLIVDEDGWAVGLLFAGGPASDGTDRTYGNPILTVLRLLDVELAL